MIEVPEKWQTMLAELQRHNPDAVLAGGAIRDLICNKIPRDLDFWVTNWTGDILATLRSWGKLSSLSMGAAEEYSDGVADTNVLKVWMIKPYWWLPAKFQTTINVMWGHFDSPLELIEGFDFGLCMAAYDGKQIIRSRHFDHGLENKVFSLRRAVYPKRVAKSTARYERKFRRKYGWPMELSGMARLDQMLAGLEAAGCPNPNLHTVEL